MLRLTDSNVRQALSSSNCFRWTSFPPLTTQQPPPHHHHLAPPSRVLCKCKCSWQGRLVWLNPDYQGRHIVFSVVVKKACLLPETSLPLWGPMTFSVSFSNITVYYSASEHPNYAPPSGLHLCCTSPACPPVPVKTELLLSSSTYQVTSVLPTHRLFPLFQAASTFIKLYLLWGLQKSSSGLIASSSLPQPPHLTQGGSFMPSFILKVLYPSISHSTDVIDLLLCLLNSCIQSLALCPQHSNCLINFWW